MYKKITLLMLLLLFMLCDSGVRAQGYFVSISSGLSPSDTLSNHYKTWKVTPTTVGQICEVKDQFMTDTLDIVQLEYLSNPVRKLVFGEIRNDTFNVVDPDDHLTWYRTSGRDTLLSIEYVNQFESTKVAIDSAQYLLLPAQKDGHLPPDSLDHYKAYRIRHPQIFFHFPVQLEDQFDRLMGTQENISILLPLFFLTPCQKNGPQGPEPTYDTVTHYVAYLISPKSFPPSPISVQTQDQFGLHTLQVLNSQLLLVPTKKDSVCELALVGDLTLDGKVTPADVVMFIKWIFYPQAQSLTDAVQEQKLQMKPLPPGVPFCAMDLFPNNSISPPDLIVLINYLFRRRPLPIEECGC